MATKGRQINTSKNVIKQRKEIATPWLKNALKSIGVSSMEVFGDYAPNVYDITSTSAKSISELSRSVRHSKGVPFTNALKNNRYIKASQTAIKNTIADLKTGNFNNTERQDEAISKAFGLDDFDSGTFFDDWDLSDENSTAFQVNNINSDPAFSIAITDQMQRGIEAQLKGQKASMDAMITISSAHMLQQHEISNQVIGHLANMENSLAAIVEFNNSTMIKYIESSMAYMESMGKKLEDNFNFSSDKIDPNSVYRDMNGGIKTGNYFNLIKQNVKSYYKGSSIGSVLDMIGDDYLELAVANPLGALTKLSIGLMTPKNLKEAIKSFDEALAGFIPTMLSKIADMGDDYGFGFGSTVRRTVGKILGVKNKRETEFDMENKITKNPTPFDEITRHSIVEVIPKYLRESNAYLKVIAERIGIDTKRAVDNSQVFDYRRGKYRSLNNIREEFYGDIRNTTIQSFDMSNFGKALRSKSTFMNDTTGKMSDQYNKMLDDFFVALEKRGKFTNIKDISPGSDLDNIIESLGYSKGMMNYLRAAINSTNRNSSNALNANAAIQNAISRRNNLIKNIESDPDSYNFYAATGGNDTIDSGLNEVFKDTFGDPKKTKTGSISEILNDVRFILNRGINVRIDGSGSYNGIKSIPLTDNDRKRRRRRRKNREENSTVNINGNNLFDDNASIEDYEHMIDEESNYFGNIEENQDTFVNHLKDMMAAIAFGSGSQAFHSLTTFFTARFEKIFDKFDENFIKPMKNSIFGEKDSTGYSRDGLFSGFQNKLLDTYHLLTREFNGKGYIDSKGNKIQDKKDGEESVVGNIKGFMKDIKDSVSDYIFGGKIFDENGRYTGVRDTKSGNFLGKAINSLTEGFEGWSEFIFGKKDDGQNKKTLNDIKKDVSDALPATITGSIAGTTIGATLGNSLLGVLFGGPVAGALIGGTMGILSRNEKFKDWLFGKEVDGERTGGLISKKVQDTFKKNKTVIMGGAALGALRGAFTGGGILGSIVGGPIAGALVGGSLGLITKSDEFKNFLFGKEGTWHKGIIPMINGVFKRRREKNGDNDDTASASKLLGMGAIGTLGGALTASMVGKLGLFGAAMTPMGPIGGAIAGLALSIKANHKGFREYLFGKDDGNGNHKAGVLERFGNMLDVELFGPMKTELSIFVDETKDFLIDKIMAPIEFAIEPITSAAADMIEHVKNNINNLFSGIGKVLHTKIIDPLVDTVRKFIIRPITRTFGFMFRAVTGIAKTIIGAPFSALAIMTNFMNARDKRDSRRRVMRENRNRGLEGFLDNMAIRFNVGTARKDAEYAYGNYVGYNEQKSGYEDRKKRYEEERKERLARHKQSATDRRRADRNRQLISRVTGQTLKYDTEENREKAQEMYDAQRRADGKRRKKLKFYGDGPYDQDKVANQIVQAGTTTEAIKNSDDPKASPTNRILGYVAKIFNILSGKEPDGKDQKRSLNQTNEQNKQNPNDSNRGVVNPLDLQNNNPNGDPDENKYGVIANWINDTSNKVSDGVSKLAQKLGIPAFEKGGTTPGGIVLTGENGPEIARLPKGTEIIPNNQAIPVVIQDMQKNASDKIAKAANEVVANPKETDAEKNRRVGSYANIMQEKEKEKERKLQEELLKSTKENTEGNKKHHSLWSFIFSKKGLVTGALLALAPLILKFLKNFDLSKIISGLGNIISWAGNTIIDSINQFNNDAAYGRDNLENDETVNERIEENKKQFGDLLKGNFLDFIMPNGEWNHQSGARFNMLGHIPVLLKDTGISNVAKVAWGAVKGTAKGINSLPGTIYKAGHTVGKAVDIARDAVTLHNNGGVMNFLQQSSNLKGAAGFQGGWKDAFKTVAGNSGITLRSTVDDAAEVALKSKTTILGTIQKAFTALTDNIFNALSKRGGNLGKAATTLKTFIDDIMKVVSKFFGRISAKISGILSATATLGSTVIGLAAKEATWVTLGAINGATGAARLFQVDPEYVSGDPLMILISSAMGALSGTTIGSILDVINELIVDVQGVDCFHEIACTVYHALAGDEKYQKLLEGKDAFKEKYEANKEKALKKQYEGYLLINGLDSKDFTFDTYRQMVEEGKIGADSQSFADFNDEQHQTIGSKIGNGVSKYLTKTLNPVKTYLFGSKDAVYQDSHGNRWERSADNPGMYNVYDSSGKLLTQQSERMIELNPDEFTKISEDTEGAISKLGKKLSVGWKYGIEAAKAIPTGIMKIISNYRDKDVDFLKYLKDDVVTGMSEENVLKPIVSGALNASKILLLPRLIMAGIGAKLGKKFAEMLTIVKEHIAPISEIQEYAGEMFGFMMKGDLGGLLTYYAPIIDDSDSNFGAILANVILEGVVKYTTALPTAVIGIGRKIGEFISSLVKNAENIGNDISENHNAIVNAMHDGDLIGLWSIKDKSSSDSPMVGWIPKVISSVEKGIMMIPTGINGLGKTIDKVLTNSPIGDLYTNIKNYVDKANEYTDPDKDMNGFFKLNFSNSSNPTASDYVLGVLVRSIMLPYVTLMRGFKTFANYIEDKLSPVKEWVDDKVDSAKTFVSEHGGVKGFVSNTLNDAASWVMDFGRGGKGGRGGSIPYYSQNDPRWKGMLYGDETMGDSGCGPDAMAMVASGLGGSREVTPVEMAQYAQEKGFRDDSGTNWNFVESASKDYGLNANRQLRPNEDFISSQLSQGKPVILSGQGGSGTPYTSGGHYVVATGKDNNGNVMINDPRGRQYSGRYKLSNVAKGANVAWGISKGGRGPSTDSSIDESTSSELEKARQAVVATMMALEGKLSYTQNSAGRCKVIQALKTGSGSGDCSSTVYYVYKECTGIDVGTSTATQIVKSTGSDVDNTSKCPDETKLLPGDLLFFKGKYGTVGHVEMYIGNGKLMGHGGPKNGPTVKDMRSFCENRAKNNHGFMKARRYILPSNAIKVSLPDAVTSGSSGGIGSLMSGAASTGRDIFSLIGNFISQFATKAWTGITTGVWDTNYDWSDGSSESSASSVSTDSSGDYADVSIAGGNNAESVWTFFKSLGYSDAATSGILANMFYESIIDPTAIQSNGKGPAAGICQWENINTKAPRWKTLYDYAASKGKQWTDLKTQLEFVDKELNGYGNQVKWNTDRAKQLFGQEGLTPIMSFEEFKQISDPGAAALGFQESFERPRLSTCKYKEKMAAARQYMQKYQGKTFGDSSKPASGSAGDFKMMEYGGGRGGDDDNLIYGYSKYADLSEDNPIKITNTVSGRGTSSIKTSISKYTNQTEGGRGNSSSKIEELLGAMIGILEKISDASISSDKKLNLLKSISGTSTQMNVTNVNAGKTTQPIIISGNGEQIVGSTKNRNASIAEKIAQGF